MSGNLTSICRAMVKNAPNGLSAEQIADLVGMTYSTLMSELSGQPRHKMGANLLLPLMQATESDAPMRYLARELNGEFTKLPLPAGCGGELVAGLAGSIREFGEFASATAERISDGDVDAAEMVLIDKETNDAVEALLAFRKLARVTHEAKYGRGYK